MEHKYALVSLTQQIQNGEKRQDKKFWRIMRAFLRNQHQQSICTWKTWTKRRIKPQRNHSLNRKTRRYDCLKCDWNIPGIMDKRTLRWPLARQPTCSRKWSFNEKFKQKSNNHRLMTFIVKDNAQCSLCECNKQLRKGHSFYDCFYNIQLFCSFDQFHSTVLFPDFVLFV